jgi:hypothetical protein
MVLLVLADCWFAGLVGVAALTVPVLCVRLRKFLVKKFAKVTFEK